MARQREKYTVKKFNKITIGLASPEIILEKSKGLPAIICRLGTISLLRQARFKQLPADCRIIQNQYTHNLSRPYFSYDEDHLPLRTCSKITSQENHTIK